MAGMNDPKYAAGDRVTVYVNAYMRSKAEAGQGDTGRSATIVGPAPSNSRVPDGHGGWTDGPPDPNTYEVTFTDGQEPSSAFVSGDYLLAPAAIRAALTARAAEATRTSQAASDEAARHAAEAKRLTDAAQAIK